MLCGFHCYWNAKSFIMALLAGTAPERAAHLCNLNSQAKFQQNYLHTSKLILESNNQYYINQTDKKNLMG